MPGKHNEPEAPAGKSGLDSENTSEGQAQDQNMNPGESSVAAPKLPHQESSSEEHGNASELSNAEGLAWKFTDGEDPDAVIKALYRDLYGDNPKRDSSPNLGEDPLPGQSDVRGLVQVPNTCLAVRVRYLQSDPLYYLVRGIACIQDRYTIAIHTSYTLL